jgi:hypothetical protein
MALGSTALEQRMQIFAPFPKLSDEAPNQTNDMPPRQLNAR